MEVFGTDNFYSHSVEVIRCYILEIYQDDLLISVPLANGQYIFSSCIWLTVNDAANQNRITKHKTASGPTIPDVAETEWTSAKQFPLKTPEGALLKEMHPKRHWNCICSVTSLLRIC